MRVYEGMFLLDPALASDWPSAESEINRVLDRANAKLIGIKNWDERRLAYQMGRHKRGLYALTYFEVEPDRIPGIERDVQLSEKFIRSMLLNREKMTEEEIRKSLDAEPPRSSSRYDDRGPRPDRPGRVGQPSREAREAREGTKPDADAEPVAKGAKATGSRRAASEDSDEKPAVSPTSETQDKKQPSEDEAPSSE